jgi:DinB superfamily
MMNLKNYFQQLHQSETETLDLISVCKGKNILHKPEGKWNVLEILEHILMTEKLVRHIVKNPTDVEAASDVVVGEAKLRHFLVEDKNRKVNAPDFLHPKGEIKSVEDFEMAFKEFRNKLKEDLTSGKIQITNRTQKHPMIGEMTITDWLHFLPLHTQKHLEQIKERILY